jgi:hypothetical protein
LILKLEVKSSKFDNFLRKMEPLDSNKTPIDEKPEDLLEAKVSSDDIESLLKRNRTSRAKYTKICLDEDREVQCYLCSEMMLMTIFKEHLKETHHYESLRHELFGVKRPFQCSVCKASLKTDPTDGKHFCNLKSIPVEKVDDKFKCPFCTKTFDLRRSIHAHLNSVHKQERRYQCDSCDYAAKSLFLLKRHKRIVHEKIKPHVCDTCGKGFHDIYFMRKHQKCHLKGHMKNDDNEESMLKCELCDRTFDNFKALNTHKTRLHEAQNIDRSGCEICGMTFTTLHYLKQHIEKEHASKEDIEKIKCHCEKCNKTFPTSVALNEHLVACLDGENPAKNFKCDNCQEDNWHSAIALRKHIAEVHGNVRDVCDICGVILKSAHYLELHKQKVHGVNATYTPCDKCGKVLPQDQIKKHISLVHENYRPFKCKECPSAYAQYALLKRHMNGKHLRDTQYKCQQCNYSTFTPGAIRTHVRMVHEKAKPNKCDHCDMAFFYKRDKIKHMSKLHHHENSN